MAVGDSHERYYAPTLVGGLNTKDPPTRLDPSESPDLENVLLHTGAVSKRGGFTPFVREHPAANAVRNRGYRGQGNDGTADGTSLIVPGSMVAGDRRIYGRLGVDLTSLTVDFFCRIDDLTGETIGSAGVAPSGAGSPITLRVRPIISKGPVKKSMSNTTDMDNDDFGAESVGRGQAHWNSTNAYGPAGVALEMTSLVTGAISTITTRQPHGLTSGNQVRLIGTGSTANGTTDGIDGVHTVTVTGPNTFTVTATGVAPEPGTVLKQPDAVGHGMPFCVYLYNDVGGKGWQFRASCHVIDPTATNYEMWTVANLLVTPEVGAIYHVIASFDYQNLLVLRIGKWNSTERAFEYEASEVAMNNANGICTNPPCPIQVFDCPQEFIERPSTAQPLWDAANHWSRPPGLNLPEATDGGYFFASKRFEGAIEDIVIRSGALTSTSDTWLDRSVKFDIEVATNENILNYWSFARPGNRLVQEDSGKGNHLYFSPDVPILDEHSGGLRDTHRSSWWFNGQTSYGAPDLQFANGRYRSNDSDPADYGLLETVIREQLPIGFQVDFWPDSLAEPFEQVLAEIHSVIRLAIAPSGHLAVYFRDDHSNSGGVQRAKYRGAVIGSTQLSTGHRYSVMAMYADGDLELYIDGIREQVQTVGACDPDGWPVGGMSVGMGSRRFTSWTNDTTSPIHEDDDTAPINGISTDSRSGFCGRIEQIQLLAREATAQYYGPRDAGLDDLRFEFTRLWDSPTTARDRQAPLFPDAAARTATGAGMVVTVGGDIDVGEKRIGQHTESTDGTNLHQGVERSPYGGHDDLDGVQVSFWHRFAWWLLDQSLDDERLRCGRFVQALEYRVRGYATTLIVPDEYRWVAEQETPVFDELQLYGMMTARCLQTDSLYERDPVFKYAGATPNREESQLVVQPFGWQSPREVGPSWDLGLVRPNVRETRISLLADWEHQQSGERFIIAASHRNLFWAKPIWRIDTPFVKPEALGTVNEGSVWLYGQDGEHIMCGSSDTGRQGLTDNPSWNVMFVDLWVKPQRLDGVRIIACRTDLSGQYNYIIGTWNGALFVAGTADSSTKAWMWIQATNTGLTTVGTTDGALRFAALRNNRWGHIAVLFGDHSGSGPASNAPVIWVDGMRLPLASYDASAAGGATADAADAGSPDNSNAMELYIGGLPRGFGAISLPMSVGGPLDLDAKSWHGMLTEFRQIDEEDVHFSGVAGRQGQVPQSRYPFQATGDPGAYLLHLSSLSSWVFPNEVEGLEQDGGRSQITELVHIGTFQQDSSYARFSHAVFRDRLYITNGLDRMLEISFRRSWHSNPQGPFRLSTAGMLQPTFGDRVTTIEHVYDSDIDSAASKKWFTTGKYVVAVAFYDSEGRESEPEPLGIVDINPATTSITGWPASNRFQLGAPHTFNVGDLVTGVITGSGVSGIDGRPWTLRASALDEWTIDDYTGGGSPANGTVQYFPDALRVVNVPRSPQSHVVGRRFYCSAFGGGATIRHDDELPDNVSAVAEIHGPAEGDLGIATGLRVVPPRARLVAVGNGALFVARLTRVAAGRASFAWSLGAEATYFPRDNLATIDSRDGKGITGLGSVLGRFFLAKRDATFVFSAGGLQTPVAGSVSVRPVNESVGVGGGLTLYDNIMFGAGERGVFRFDGTNVVYASSALENDWQRLPVRDEDLLGMDGAYNREQSEYWLSVRRPNQEANDRVYVLQVAVGDRQAWTRLLVPPHTVLRHVVDPVSQRPVLLLGTISGQILRYDPGVYIDGHDDVPMPGESDSRLTGSGTLAGRTITIASGKFDTVRDGLRGTPIIVVASNGQAILTTVESNTDQTLTFRDTFAQPGAVFYTIGNYQAYWTSGWIGPRVAGEWLLAREIDLEFRPDDTNLTVVNAVAIQPADSTSPHKPTRKLIESGAALEQRVVALDHGYLDETLGVREQNTGRYFRVLVGTSTEQSLTGIRNPWELWGWGFRFNSIGLRGGRPR